MVLVQAGASGAVFCSIWLEIWYVLTVSTMLVRSRTLIWKAAAKENALSTSFSTTVLRDVHQSAFSTIGHLVLDEPWRVGIGTKGPIAFPFFLSLYPRFYWLNGWTYTYTYSHWWSCILNIVAPFSAGSGARSAGRMVSAAASVSASASWSTLLVLGLCSSQSFTNAWCGKIQDPR